MKKILFPALILFVSLLHAREGIWLPQLLKSINENEMKLMGMEISAEDIYNINKSSLKDAVVQFGGGCTGEIISSKGLLITNHHCGFYQIQSLSTIEKNYLDSGYWSKSYEDELPCPGLTVTFIREITEVTEAVIRGFNDTLNEDTRAALIKQRSDSIEKSVDAKYKGLVRAFYQGNKYYLFKTEVFSDIRFVGAPPQSIGKFGGETDNWMWPRHTGDFSLFRIYSDKNNQAAKYSKDNIPYVPKQSLTINIGGVKENDFVMVYGFPGRTNEYLLSPGLETIAEQTNPNRIAIRDIRLNILRDAMQANDTIRLQYASKFATLENAYKKWKGELLGFKRFNAVEKKKEQEKYYRQQFSRNSMCTADTGIFNEYKKLNDEAKPLNFANDFYAEAFPGIEIFNGVSRLNKLKDFCADKKNDEKLLKEEIIKCKNDFRGFYKNNNSQVDKKICEEILGFSYSKVPINFLPEIIRKEGKKSKGDFSKYAINLYKKSLISDSSRIMKFLSSFQKKDTSIIKKDPAYILWDGINQIQQTVQADLSRLNMELLRQQRKYMSGLMTIDTTGRLYPDANSTLRLSYGRVQGIKPYDGMSYTFNTTTDGIIQKSETGESDYQITPRLEELIRKKDFGRYGPKGILPVAFLSSVHTTGGNSGSPVLNSKGELVGVNYDRVWEGVLSDYYFDEKYCRNISLDIRYALFIIEKYGNANRLISEMKLAD